MPLSSRPVITLLVLIIACLATMSCATKPELGATCISESDAGWRELSLAKAKGFSGTLSYAKALSLLTAARTMQSINKYDSCYRNAKEARKHIHNSYEGH